MIEMNITNNVEPSPMDTACLEPLAQAVCERFDVTDAAVGIVIVDDAEFRRLNQQFLERDGTSDCLSFDLSDEQQRCFELVINADVAITQAKTRGHSIEAEMALYVVHGLLHQLGFDDGDDVAAPRMHAMEDEILSEQGYGNVYAD